MLFANLHVLFYVLFLTLLQGCLGAIYDAASNLPTTVYDFVIVGDAPCNLLWNLVDLVITSNAGVENIAVPYMVTDLGSTYDWNFTTTPQSGHNGRPTAFPRGFVLGGSTSVNAMIYTRGSPDDWNRYVALSGDSGWSWDAVQPYIAKVVFLFSMH
ncbi:GMC oxidoreductase-domain-containing protein [Mucidula mucida]|nr:GMC oxidoreductase-domain-containing protein [Mucidula mucida]